MRWSNLSFCMKKFSLIVAIVVLVYLGYRFIPFDRFYSEKPSVNISQSTSTVFAGMQPSSKSVKEEVLSGKEKKENKEDPSKKSISVDMLAGDWEVENNFYEFITLESDGAYSTYLNDRLLVSGTWKLDEAGALSILPNIDVVPGEIYQHVELNNDVLSLNNGEVVWKKM